jgi:hypothetical protein
MLENVLNRSVETFNKTLTCLLGSFSMHTHVYVEVDFLV